METQCPYCGEKMAASTELCLACGKPLAAQPPGGSQQPYTPTPAAQQQYAPPASPPGTYGYAPYPMPPMQNDAGSFREKYLGLIVLAVYAVPVFLMFLVSAGQMFSGRGGQYFIQNLFTLFPVAVGITLTLRSKGPDLSCGLVMSFSGVLFALSGSILPSLICVLVVGAITGALIVYLKLNSIIVSLVMSALLYGINGSISGMQAIEIDFPLPGVIGVILSLLAVAGGFLLVFFTSLGTPRRGRSPAAENPLTMFLAYPIGAFFVGISGILQASRLRMGVPTADTHYYLLLIILLWASLRSSACFDNRVAPVLVALLHIVLRVALSYSMNILSINSFAQTIVQAFYTMLFVIVAGIATLPPRKQQAAPQYAQ